MFEQALCEVAVLLEMGFWSHCKKEFKNRHKEPLSIKHLLREETFRKTQRIHARELGCKQTERRWHQGK